MESYTSDIVCVSLKCCDRIWVGRLDIVEFDGSVARGGKVSFVWGDAEPVYLGIRMLKGSRADPREGLPETRPR